MKAMWPGIYGNAGGSPHVISKRRKLAVQASRFMVQMVQTPLFSAESTDQASKSPESTSGSADVSNNFDIGEEGLAIRIAVEVYNLEKINIVLLLYDIEINILTTFVKSYVIEVLEKKLTSNAGNVLGSHLPR